MTIATIALARRAQYDIREKWAARATHFGRYIMTKQEILRVAYVTGTSDRTVRNVLRDLNHSGVQRMSAARRAVAEELSRATT